MKQSYSDKAIKLAIKYGYTGGWHQPNKDVFDDENFWRSAGRAFDYHEWRNLYERYLDRMRYGESNNEFWRVIFIESKYNACCEKYSGRIEDENNFSHHYGCQNHDCDCHRADYGINSLEKFN